MYTTTVHVLFAEVVKTFRLRASAHARTGDVFAVFCADVLPGNPRIRNLAGECAQADTPWYQWCVRAPITVIEHPGEEHGKVATTSALAARALPTRDRAWLHVAAGPDAGFAVRYEPGMTIGRSQAATLQVLDPHLSRSPVPAGSGDVTGVTSVRVEDPRERASAPPPVEWPEAPKVNEPRKPHILHYVAPVVIGVVLMLVTHMWWFLLFSVAGPVTAGLTWWFDTRRYRRALAQAVVEFRREVSEFQARVLRAGHEAGLVQVARPYTLTRLPLGVGRWCVPALVGTRPSYETPFDRVAAGVEISGVARPPHTQLCVDGQVLTVDLSVTNLVLSGESAASVVRALVAAGCQLGAGVQVIGEQVFPEFAGLAGNGAGSGQPVLRVEVGETIRVSLDMGGGLAGGAGREAADTWFVECGSHGNGVLHCAEPGSSAQPGSQRDGTGPLPGPVALRCMRAHRFVSLIDPPVAAHTQTELNPVSVYDLGEGEQHTRTGDRKPHNVDTAVAVGVTGSGVARIDLIGDGPHALVAGTTGSGKSVFLSAWIHALALKFSPAEVRFVLIDFKGGAAFTPLSTLPHTDCVVSNLSSVAGLRALKCVLAEVMRRERLLAQAGVADCEAYNRVADAPLPRLITVIDEFQALVQQVPESVEMLEQLTALGRSLGIHAVLATQRPAGVVTARMKSNIALRVCLRVRDASDSRDIIDADDAAGLDPTRPGLGILSTGHRRELFRSAHTGRSDTPHATWEHWGSSQGAVSVELAEPRAQPEYTPSPYPPHTVVAPPLPERVDQAITAIIDTPGGSQLSRWTYDPGVDGSVIIGGGPGTGKSHALAVLAGGVSATHLVVGFGRPGSRCAAAHVWADSGWMREAALSLLENLPVDEPVFVVLDDTDDAFSPAQQARLDAIVTSRPFAWVTGKRSVGASVAARAATRLTFPPAVAADAVFFGVKPGRFAGMDYPGRGLLTGPGFPHRDGVDAQVSLHVSRTLRAVPRVGAGVVVGESALGGDVMWDVADGTVLNVCGPEALTGPFLDAVGARLPASAVVVPRAHEQQWEAGEVTVVACPLEHTPGFTSPLAQARSRGPLLVLGARTPQELAGVTRDVPFIPPGEGLGWFVTATRRIPVRPVV